MEYARRRKRRRRKSSGAGRALGALVMVGLIIYLFTASAAGNLITKLKNADLIEPVSGFGKGKYKFVSPKV